MSRRKVSPEAQIIALFTGLSDEGKRMVMFGLNAIMSNEGPKQPASTSAPSAVRKSSRKGAAPLLIQSSEDDSGNASSASSNDPKCGICGNPEEYQDHFQPSPNYHPFEAPKVKKAKSA